MEGWFCVLSILGYYKGLGPSAATNPAIDFVACNQPSNNAISHWYATVPYLEVVCYPTQLTTSWLIRENLEPTQIQSASAGVAWLPDQTRTVP